MSDPGWLADIKFSDQGLIPAIAQDAQTKRILMVGWMNRDALLEPPIPVRPSTGPDQGKNSGERAKSQATRSKSGKSGWTATAMC